MHFTTCGHTVEEPTLPNGYADFGGRCPACKPARIVCDRPSAATRADRERRAWQAKLDAWRSA